MPTLEITIINKLGLHARAAAKLVKEAARFSAQIEIEKSGNRVNAKSIMGVMMLAASCNTVIQVHAQGQDQDEALEAIKRLIEDRFGEDE